MFRVRDQQATKTNDLQPFCRCQISTKKLSRDLSLDIDSIDAISCYGLKTVGLIPKASLTSCTSAQCLDIVNKLSDGMVAPLLVKARFDVTRFPSLLSNKTAKSAIPAEVKPNQLQHKSNTQTLQDIYFATVLEILRKFYTF